MFVDVAEWSSRAGASAWVTANRCRMMAIAAFCNLLDELIRHLEQKAYPDLAPQGVHFRVRIAGLRRVIGATGALRGGSR